MWMESQVKSSRPVNTPTCGKLVALPFTVRALCCHSPGSADVSLSKALRPKELFGEHCIAEHDLCAR